MTGASGPGADAAGSDIAGSDAATETLYSPGWHRAREAAYAAPSAMAAQTLPLQMAIGHTLAEDVHAEMPVPHYSSSAMDGWAVAGDPPWHLIDGVTAARAGLDAGEAVPVLTGGLIPAGTFGVLRTEHGRVDDVGGANSLQRGQAARAAEPSDGEHVRPSGEEAAAGEVVLGAGTVLNPAQIALAAICGLDDLPVLRCPRVTLLRTGDEVIEAGVPVAGEVRDTFGPVMPAFVALLGGDVTTNRHLADRFDDLLQALDAEAVGPTDLAEASADVVITTGGTGASSADHLRTALADLGAELIVDGIAMRPGHPALLGRLPDGRFIVGLPGNPLAAMMTTLTLVRPLLAGLRGERMPPLGRAVAGESIPAVVNRDRLIPYTLVDGVAVPARWVRSGMLRGLAAADGVLVVPAAGAEPGQVLATIELPWR